MHLSRVVPYLCPYCPFRAPLYRAHSCLANDYAIDIDLQSDCDVDSVVCTIASEISSDLETWIVNDFSNVDCVSATPTDMCVAYVHASDCANVDQATVIGRGRETSPNSTGGLTQREP